MGELGAGELRLMQDLAQQVTATRPDRLNGDATVGELAWVWSKDVGTAAGHWRHRFWFAGDRLAGWGWAHLSPSGGPAELIWQTDLARPELLEDILDWYDEVAAGVERTVVLQATDTDGQGRMAAHGYAVDAEAGSAAGSWHQWNARTLDDLPEPVLPNGFRFRSAADTAIEDVLAAHRAGWPSSRMDTTSLARVQQTWPYRPELHVLVQAPDGQFVGSAIAWYDDVTRTAEFEPVGTHRDHRRRGLGAALQLHGMRRVREAGGTRMFVACLAGSGHPAARGLYESVGFRRISHDVPYVKPAQPASTPTAP